MRDLSFSKLALAAMAASILVHVLHFIGLSAWFILAVNVVSLILLSDQAVRFARADRSDFDGVIAAETIVAFGVMCLILGLATGLLPLFLRPDVDLGDSGTLKALAMPFIFGLATAGLAPFAAMVLRNRTFESARAADPADEMEGLHRAARDLTRQMRAAQRALEEMQTCAVAAGASTRRLADVVETEASRLAAALDQGETHVRSFGAAAGTGRAEIAGLADETVRLKGAASDASTLLDALAKLIESVERFVAPARDAR